MPVAKDYIDFVDAETNNQGGVAVFSVDVPAGASAGEKALLVLAIRDDRTFDPFADAWNALWEASDTSSGVTVGCWWIEIDAAMITAGSWGFTCSGGNSSWAGAVVVYDGLTAFAGGTGDAGNLASPALNLDQGVLADQATSILYVGGARGASTIGFTPPSGFTERADISHTVNPCVAVTVAEKTTWTFGDAGPWTATASGSPSKFVAGWVAVYGALDFIAPTITGNPNTVQRIDVPFLDGTHALWAGWSGGLLLAEANIGGSGFRLNDDTYGRLNTARLGPADDGWVDIGADLAELNIVAGASDDAGILSRSEAGQAQIVLKDWAGKWDPTNADSPYAQDWRLGCLIRVGFTAYEYLALHEPSSDLVDDVDSWLWKMFLGRVDEMIVTGLADEDPIVTVIAVDAIATLSASDPLAQDPIGTCDLIDERVQRILDNVGSDVSIDFAAGHPEWNGTGSSGETYEYQSTTMAQPAWTEILLTCDAALSIPVLRGDGTMYLAPQAPNTFSYRRFEFAWDGVDMAPVDVQPAYNRAQLRNVVTFAKIGGTEQSVADTESISRHGGRFEYSRNDLPLSNDDDVLDLAGRVLARSADPTPRITSIGFWPQLFGSNLEHDVTAVFDGAELGTVASPVYGSLARLISHRHAEDDLLDITWRDARSGIEQSQVVMVRGFELRITPDEWQVRFVTTSIDSWFDIWTLADSSDTLLEAEQSRLSRGHRLAAA